MNIIIGTQKFELTPSLETYVNQKLAPLAKFIRRVDEKGGAELRIELARTTKHHKKGEVFAAVADLRLPKKILRAEEEAKDIRTAIDLVRDTLHMEIEKYKTKFLEPRRGGRS